MIALDTNLLVYAHRRSVPEHRGAREAVLRAARDPAGWGISQPVVAEFWSIVTHPTASGGPSTPAQAASFLRGLMRDGEMKVWMARDDFTENFSKAAVTLAVSGGRVFDLQIALIAAEHGAREIWTHDRNFLRLPGLRIHDPL